MYLNTGQVVTKGPLEFIDTDLKQKPFLQYKILPKL